MAPQRHPPTLIISSLPKNALVGIDLLSLTASPRFHGFTALPPGWHFLFAGATTDLSSRQGLWFHVPDADDDGSNGGTVASHAGHKRQRADSQTLGVRGEVMAASSREIATAGSRDADTAVDWLAVLAWDPDTEQLRPVDDAAELERWRAKLLASAELQRGLFPYRRSVPPVRPGDDSRVEELDQESEGDETPARGGGESEKVATEPPQDFPSLASRISAATLDRICGSPLPAGVAGSFWTLDTGSATALEEESEKIPGLEYDGLSLGQSLGLVNFDLKMTWPPDAVGRARTEAARDKSWKLGQLVEEAARASQEPMVTESAGVFDVKNRETRITGPAASSWGSDLLGEIQFCFLMAMCLVNWSCLQQWKRLVELCLTCETAVGQRPSFFTDLLSNLQLQLRHSTLVEGGLFDLEADGGEFLKGLLRRFGTALGEASDDVEDSSIQPVIAAFDRVRGTVKEIWDWELTNDFVKQGFLQLEDGEMVELETKEAEYEEESGEYAPVIVEN